MNLAKTQYLMPEKDRQLMVERRERTRSNYGISSKTSHKGNPPLVPGAGIGQGQPGEENK